MKLENKDASHNAWIALHDPPCRLGISVEDTNSANFAFTTNGANDGKYPVRAKLEIATTVLPNDFLVIGTTPLRPGFQYDDTVRLGLSEHLALNSSVIVAIGISSRSSAL